ncbi:hypothetical protein [Fontivita pretiosa]|uniref:hypothetical protein n=1 Tax=Fontivita pretiosa TaxID=2989684 RepID=UPI003D183BB7
MQEPHKQDPPPLHEQQPSDDTGIRRLRHDVFNGMHALNLCICALPTLTDDDERLHYLQEITTAADRVITLLDELEAAMAGGDMANNHPPGQYGT